MLNFASEAEAKMPCEGYGVRMICYDAKDREWRRVGEPDKATRLHNEAKSKLLIEYQAALRVSELQKIRDQIAALKKR